MKIRTCAALLIACMGVSLLTGCAVRETVRKLDAAEEMVEHRLDVLEDAVEASFSPAAKSADRPENKEAAITENLLTSEEAQEIVLNHAGFAADDVQWLRTEFEIDDRVPQYDVQFRQGWLEYEYEVHGETGEILSMEVDD